MLSSKTRKSIETINNYDTLDNVVLSTDSFLCEVIDVASLLKHNNVYIPLMNSSGDTIYISPGTVGLQTSVSMDGFNSGVYSTIYPTILIRGDNKTPHVTNLSKMLSIFNERHHFKESLSKLLKDNIEQTLQQLTN